MKILVIIILLASISGCGTDSDVSSMYQALQLDHSVVLDGYAVDYYSTQLTEEANAIVRENEFKVTTSLTQDCTIELWIKLNHVSVTQINTRIQDLQPGDLIQARIIRSLITPVADLPILHIQVMR